MSGLPRFYPWQEPLARQWLAQRERFAHAWLIHGVAGIGKKQFALAAAASLLCEQPDNGIACGQCMACRWVAGGNHPDIRRIRPDALAQAEQAPDAASAASSGKSKSPSKDIRIDQLRSLESWFNTATHLGGWRVAVLYPAHALNPVSANALLKILEEPPAQTVFLLVAEAPDRLLPTLVSRCRRLALPVPDSQLSEQWLAEQGISQPHEWLAAASFAPVRAAELATEAESPCPAWLATMLQVASQQQSNPDVGALADTLERIEPLEWIDPLQRLTFDLQLLNTGQAPRYFPSLTAAGRLAPKLSAQRLSNLSRWLHQQRQVCEHPLNAKLFVHDVLQQVVLAWRVVPD